MRTAKGVNAEADVAHRSESQGGEEARPRTQIWLLLGIVVTALSGARFNVAALGWVAFSPWLVYLRRASHTWRDVVMLMLALEVGVGLSTAKIFADIFPWFFAPLFAFPAVLIQSVTLLLFERLRRVLGDGWGLAVFPAISVVVEWIGWAFTSQSSWGSLAYTQIDDLALLQVASLFGLGGISFIVAASSAVTAVLLDNAGRPANQHLPVAAGVGAAVVAAQAWGSWRLDKAMPPGPTITVAAVGSDLDFIEVLKDGGLPADAELDRAEAILFNRTLSATEAGAELVVWNEASTVAADREAEAALLDRGERMARDRGVDVVMGYAVPLDDGMMRRFENKYVWMGPEGGPIDTYFKRNPAPGEGSVPGTEPLRALQRPWGRAAGAICYDYDFPAIGLAHARGGAGIVAVPASDWRGIDPYHTTMASVRGIEGGFSVVRSVHWGTSGAYDPFGRTLATSSWFSDEQRIMLARVPVTPVPTLYAQVGDVLPWTCLGLVVVSVGLAAFRGRCHDMGSLKPAHIVAQPSPELQPEAAPKAKAA